MRGLHGDPHQPPEHAGVSWYHPDLAVRLHRHSFRDYLAVEEVSRVKHEFLDGEIYAMAGGSILHAALASYPDVSVVCGDVEAIRRAARPPSTPPPWSRS